MSGKQWFVFTFGYNQPNEGKYVRIYGTYSEARQKMIDKYGRNWAFQYTAYEWADWEMRRPPWLPTETLLEVID